MRIWLLLSVERTHCGLGLWEALEKVCVAYPRTEATLAEGEKQAVLQLVHSVIEQKVTGRLADSLFCNFADALA